MRSLARRLIPVSLVRRVFGPWVGRFAWLRVDHARPLRHVPQGRPRVLVVGVYLADKPNLAAHLVSRFAASAHCEVTQRWVAIGPRSSDPAVAAVTVESIGSRVPKFELVNRHIGPEDVAAFDYIMVCDDDVSVSRDFVDRFIGWQQRCGFALAQPARTWNSFVDHRFVRQSLLCRARETRFVEIGPIFCFERALARVALPFDMTSAMGYGYDLVWPVLAHRHGLTLGIVDDAAVEHAIRDQATQYAKGPELQAMGAYLASREHLSFREAFVVRRRYH
jgi:hypothetical protein